MNLLAKASGSRPRLACEIAPDGVTAARAVLVAQTLVGKLGVRIAHDANLALPEESIGSAKNHCQPILSR